MSTNPKRDPGSFRDPDGFVTYLDDRVFRVLTPRGAAGWKQALDSGAIDELHRRELIVPTRELASDDPLHDELRSSYPEAAGFIEHERIELMTWPAEWTNAMLADAGLHTLKVQLCLLERKLALKDATAFNIAFVDGTPRFIDVTSILRPERLDIWYALGQFQRMFLYPLLLAQRGFTPADVFLNHIDGLTPRQTADALGRWGWLNPGKLFSVYLPAWLEGRSSALNGSESDTPTGNPEVQRTILNSNRRKLQRLREKLRPRGVWVDYRHEHSYSDSEESVKREFVKVFALEHKPRTAIDLGANTGEYSRLLAETCDRVIAVEGDHDALDVFHRENDQRNIQLVRANLANPTPGIGYMNIERAPLLQRLKGDATFALAIVHHLLVSAGLSVPHIAALLTRFAPCLVVEYVAPTDPMFRKLVEGRENLWGKLDEHQFVRAFTELGWHVERRQSIKDGGRILFALSNPDA